MEDHRRAHRQVPQQRMPQGRLLYMDDASDAGASEIYVLEDHVREMWIFKHRVNRISVLGPLYFVGEQRHFAAALHPSCDRIFFYDRRQKRLMYCDMSQECVGVICTLGEVAEEKQSLFPYVPLYSRTLDHLMISSASQSRSVELR